MTELSTFDKICIFATVYILIGLVQSRNHYKPCGLSMISRQALLENNQLPSYFKYKEALLTPIRNQSNCSSCWAFACTSAFADTLAIASRGKFNQLLSPQYLMSCTDIGEGCLIGASPEEIYNHKKLVHEGIPLESEFPYTHLDTTPCPAYIGGYRVKTISNTQVDCCIDPANILPGFKSIIINQNIKNMKHALMEYGPILGTLKISKSLIEYDASKNGIFTETYGEKVMGHHAISIIGWCDANINIHEPGFYDDGYWIIRNSYGNGWSVPHADVHDDHKHFAYIKMGCNTNDIESRASICHIEIPDKYNLMTNMNDVCYTSYTDYIEDPERLYYYHELAALKTKNSQT
jgi:cathepsin B